MYSRFDITVGSLLYRDDYRDYYLAKGWRGSLDWKMNSALNAKVAFNDERQSGVSRNTNYSIFPESYDCRVNPAINDGYLRSVDLSLNLDTRKFLDTGMSMRSDEGSNYWVCKADVETSSPRFLNSAFSFDRFHLEVMRHQMAFASGYLNVWAASGTAIGKLPVQRMFEIQSAYGGYSEGETLETLAVRRLLTTTSIVVAVDHDFANSLFRWSNIPLVRDAWFNVRLFAHGAAADGYSPMAEVGFGLVNILPFIRTNFAWCVAGACRGFAWTIGTAMGI